MRTDRRDADHRGGCPPTCELPIVQFIGLMPTGADGIRTARKDQSHRRTRRKKRDRRGYPLKTLAARASCVVSPRYAATATRDAPQWLPQLFGRRLVAVDEVHGTVGRGVTSNWASLVRNRVIEPPDRSSSNQSGRRRSDYVDELTTERERATNVDAQS
jgi:hypothetical protein